MITDTTNSANTTKTKIHLISDLHIDLRDDIKSINEIIFTPKTKNIILVLAGDIGNPTEKKYWKFLESCCMVYSSVIFITGNHEYYNSELTNFTESEINSIIENKIKPLNLHFLHKNTITINGITFMGTTLWTKLDKKYKKNLIMSVNDFNNVLCDTVNSAGSNGALITNKKKLTIESRDLLYEDQLNWLKNSIKNETNNKIVIITHHLPLPQLSHEKYKKYEKSNSAFYTDLLGLHPDMFNDKIKYWLCGHTHTKMSYIDPETKIEFHVNPMGYIGENNTYDVLEIEI